MNHTRRLIAIGLILAATPANAMTNDGHYVSVGWGLHSCGTYVKARRVGDPGPMNWVAGFITAYNMTRGDTYNIAGPTDLEGLLAWLDNYCRDHPTNLMDNAVGSLIAFLYPNRYQTKP